MRDGLYVRPNLDEQPAETDKIEWDHDDFPYEQRPGWPQDNRHDVYDAPERSWQGTISNRDRQQRPGPRGYGIPYNQPWQPTHETHANGASSSLASAPLQHLPSPNDAWGRSTRGEPSRVPTRPPSVPSPDDMLSRGGALHGVSMRTSTRFAYEAHSPQPPSRPTFTLDAYPTPLRAPARDNPAPESSPISLADPRLPITPTSAYTQSRRLERKPLGAAWHTALRSPRQPPAPKEWSTLPPKRRQRITMHPDASRPIRSKFRLPINLLSGRKLPSRQPAPRLPSPSPPSGSSLYTGPVTITKWTPRTLSQSAGSHSTAQRGYVPPNMRALKRMGDSSPEQNGRHSTSTPQGSPAVPYFVPPSQPRSSPYQPQPGVNPYAKRCSLAPGPLAGQEEDDDDGWAAAWRLSANGKGAVGASGGR